MLFVIWSTRRDKNKIYIVYVITQPVSNNEYFLIKPSKIYIYHISKKKYTAADPGEGFPLFLDQTETRRAEKFFLETAPPPPLPYLRVWMAEPPRFSQGLDPALI